MLSTEKRQWICFSFFPSCPPPLPPVNFLHPNRPLAIERTGWGTAELKLQQPKRQHLPGQGAGTGAGPGAAQPLMSHHALLTRALEAQWTFAKYFAGSTLTFHMSSHFLSFPLYESSTFVFKLHKEIFKRHLNVLTKLCRREELRP